MRDRELNRFELIDWTENSRFGGGRVKVIWGKDISIIYELQDDGRTLKVFIRDLLEKKLKKKKRRSYEDNRPN